MKRGVRLVSGAFGAILGTVAALILAFDPAQAVETSAKQAIVVDYQTGTVLFEKNADMPIHPASMSKLMTLYVLFEQLKKGQLKLDDSFRVSENAWAHNEGSTMFVNIDSQVRIEDLIRGIIVQSGNDACIVVAEGMAGTEAEFVELMNKKAAEIGLVNSMFANVHGLEHPDHRMTARDLAVLARRLYEDFPDYYPYFAEKEFEFSGIKQGNRNPLLYKNIGADGLKTGHLEVSGYGIAASAEQGGRRVFVVLHGMDSEQTRSDEATRMIEWAFREFKNYTLAKAGDVIDEAAMWYGAQETVPLTIEKDLIATLPRSGRDQMEVKAVYQGPINAPIQQGQVVGKLTISAPGYGATEVPLIAAATVERQGIVSRAISTLRYLVLGG